ncbi:MAG: septation protein SpoVG family protein [Pseudomonadota bacterium]
MKISEVNISFVKPCDGLVGFASLVIDGQIYVGSIAIHKRLGGDGYRLTYPNGKSNIINRPVVHPITHECGRIIEEAVVRKFEDVMRKHNDRYDSNHI